MIFGSNLWPLGHSLIKYFVQSKIFWNRADLWVMYLKAESAYTLKRPKKKEHILFFFINLSLYFIKYWFKHQNVCMCIISFMEFKYHPSSYDCTSVPTLYPLWVIGEVCENFSKYSKQSAFILRWSYTTAKQMKRKIHKIKVF